MDYSLRTEVASVLPPTTKTIWNPAKSESFVVPVPSFQATEIVPKSTVAPGAGEVNWTSAIAKDAKAVMSGSNRMSIVCKGETERG